MKAGGKLVAVNEESGFLGNFETKTAQKQNAAAPNYPTAWLSTERVARAWEAMVLGQ